ncbi:MAG TPA: hypothetical protein VJN44_05505, partial [Roseateles sp.]|nr:hypothetical protein [Roseateles sp.]
VGAKVVTAREQGTAELYTRVVARCAEMVCWPTDQLDEALMGAVGTVFFALQQEAVRDGLSDAQWAERMAVTREVRDRQMASPDASAEETAGFEEVKAYNAMVQQYQGHDHVQGLKAKHLYGLRLHLGLMQCLAATVAEA